MHSALLAWQEEAAGQAMARREAERLRTVADYVRLTRCWREWRGRVDGARRLQALLQRTQAHLACLREAQVGCAKGLTRPMLESDSASICRDKVPTMWLRSPQH